MPGKSRHGKGKHARTSKKSRAKQRHGVALQQPAVAEAPLPAVTTGAPPPPRAPAPPARLKADQYTYVTTELRRIGILAGIILAILVVLALVLS
jgi:hypothetical protein